MSRARRLVIATAFVAAVYLTGILGYYALGRGAWSLLDCVYMATVTVTTVGYSESLPVGSTATGQLFNIGLIVLGVSSLLYFFSTFMAFLIEGDLADILGRTRMSSRLKRMREHVIVCGAGRTGSYTTQQVVRDGRDLVLVDEDEEALQHVIAECGVEIPHVVGDATEEAVLRRAGIGAASGLVCALPTDHANLYTVLTAKDLNPELRIVSKISDESVASRFLKVGAHAVVSPHAMGGRRLFAELVQPATIAYLENLLMPSDLGLQVREVQISPLSKLAGQTLAKADVRQQVGNVIFLAIRDGDTGELRYNPRGDCTLAPGATLIVVGAADDLLRLEQVASEVDRRS